VDFEQPRALYTKVLNDTDREHLIQNIAASLGGVQSAEIKARQRKLLVIISS
jgi:catalase